MKKKMKKQKKRKYQENVKEKKNPIQKLNYRKGQFKQH